MAEPQQEQPRFFLIGICGAGMSSLALLLHSLKMNVRGSDAVRDGSVVDRLALAGIPVMTEEEAAGAIKADDTIVYSSAIHQDNIVMAAAVARHMRLRHRADLLAEIASRYFLVAVAGTHGKTTTAGMIGYALAKGGFTPTVYVGGHIMGFDKEFPMESLQKPVVSGRPVMVLETDESDASFLKFHPDVAIMTNIDKDHLGTYGGRFESLVDAFEKFAWQCSERSGLVIGFGDDAAVARIASSTPKHVLYGESASSQIQVVYDRGLNTATILRNGHLIPFAMQRGDEKGYLNAVAASLACEEVGMPFDDALHALEEFPGMERRMQVLSVFQGVTILTDHADHPTEIKATMQAISARYPGRPITLVLQPHRYSRVSTCLQDYGPAMKGAARVVLLGIFPAGETAQNPEELNAALRKHVLEAVGEALEPWSTSDDVLTHLQTSLLPNDVVVFMGPGDVNRLGSRFCALLKSDNAVKSQLPSPREESQRRENDR